MKTPKEYEENLKYGIITQKMLIDCLYSCNKRAKNCRDAANGFLIGIILREYYNQKMKKLYKEKEKLLSILYPTCIHKEPYKYQKKIIKETDKEFKRKYDSDDYEKEYQVWDNHKRKNIKCIEINTNKSLYHYYLYYDMGGEHSFHQPIEKEDLNKYKGLFVQEIKHLKTTGEERNRLINNEFVKKIIKLIERGKYKYCVND